MTGTSYQKGQQTEQAAEQYLIAKGLTPIARNIRFRTGEIDLVMQDGNYRVFIEVRFRKHARFGSAAESINYNKQQRLIRSAMLYNQRYPSNQPWRIDAVVLTPGQTENYHFQWLQSAIHG